MGDILHGVQQNSAGNEDVSHANIWGKILGSSSSPRGLGFERAAWAGGLDKAGCSAGGQGVPGSRSEEACEGQVTESPTAPPGPFTQDGMGVRWQCAPHMWFLP